MGAPEGNQFWKLRSKHGRDKIFSSGEMIDKSVDEFMSALYENPIKEHDFVGKDATEVEKNKYRVPTWNRFANFCGVHSAHFLQLKHDLKDKTDEFSKDIYAALMRADDLFYSEKFEMASAGLANASLIGKHLGIHEIQKVDVTSKGEKINTQPSEIKVTIVPPVDDDDE